MQHPFLALEPEYVHLMSVAKITRPGPVRAGVAEILKVLPSYLETERETAVPASWLGPVDCRESDCNPRCGIGQGDPWNRVSTHVPAGEGPFATKAAADKFYLHYDHVDVLPAGQTWTLPWGCWRAEAWNGFGPRAHGRLSGYLWSCTDVYDPPRLGGHGDGGKYVADGRWDPGEVDVQPGWVALYLELIQQRPELAAAMGVPSPSIVLAQGPVPAPPPVGVHDAHALQMALNALGAAPKLKEDGSFGRLTRRAVVAFQHAHGLEEDGVAGPLTWAAITEAIKT